MPVRISIFISPRYSVPIIPINMLSITLFRSTGRKLQTLSNAHTHSHQLLFNRTSMSSASSAQQFRLVYNWQDDVENLEHYRVGGYHPVELGDQFAGSRYQIVHKLGYGGSSTVWLAKDHIKNRYVSLKILKAKKSDSGTEARIGALLREGNQSHPGRSYVLSLLDEFYFDGPNGRHQCLVSDVTGPSVKEVKEATEHEMLSVETAQNITAQLAVGLAFIHSCGIVHGGKGYFFSSSTFERWRTFVN